jgi:hypothetical protein
MSRNGSGTYTLPAGNPVVTGTTISTTWANNTLNDIAATLTDSVAADGQTPMTGDLDLNNNKIKSLANGTLADDAATVGQLAASVAGFGTMSTQNANAVAITGGTVNGTSVGATTASTGAFTDFTASGTASFTSTGALKVPVGTTAQQPTPVTGQIRYNTSNNQYEGYGASSWGSLGGGATGGGGNQVFVENDQNVTTNYTITSGKNAMSAGPITVDSGVTVTVPTGSVWTIV